MKIDEISKNLILIALYLDKKVPGIVSEIWLDELQINELRSIELDVEEVITTVKKTLAMSEKLSDKKRKTYIQQVVGSLEYQIRTVDANKGYATFSKKSFGYQIDRVSEEEIRLFEEDIFLLEKKIGSTRQEVFKKHKLEKTEYQSTFQYYVKNAKKTLPDFIFDFPDNGFEFETTTGKPWSAFNSHIAPFRSKLTINTDVGFSKLDLHRLSFHEAYGGHHSELSNKDKLLVEEGKGEHGLVITFSPQTFVSEAIAEGIYVLLGGLDANDDEQVLGWKYDRLTFALQNAATFWFFDDEINPTEIKSKLESYAISKQTIENITNFCTDPLFGKYAPVYYTAYNFISDLYKNTNKKQELISALFTEPCTPSMLMDDYS